MIAGRNRKPAGVFADEAQELRHVTGGGPPGMREAVVRRLPLEHWLCDCKVADSHPGAGVNLPLLLKSGRT